VQILNDLRRGLDSLRANKRSSLIGSPFGSVRTPSSPDAVAGLVQQPFGLARSKVYASSAGGFQKYVVYAGG
jgi:hypothetical protein